MKKIEELREQLATAEAFSAALEEEVTDRQPADTADETEPIVALAHRSRRDDVVTKYSVHTDVIVR